MKIIYITGCLGFIGSYFTRLCLTAGYYVIGVDLCTYAASEKALREFTNCPNFKFLNEDISKLTSLLDCDYIVNFAAESHVDNSLIDSNQFMISNILGVKNLLDLIKNKNSNCGGKPKLIHTSTDEVYGDIETGMHVETDLLKPSNPYSASKASADMLILAWARTYGIKYNIIRPTNNYGVGQYPEKLIPITIKSFDRGLKVRLHNEGKPIRTWLHVEDTVNAIYTVMTLGLDNEIYNISGGFSLPNLEVVKAIVSYYYNNQEYEKYIDYSYSRPGQDVRYALDDSKIRALGWKPEKSFFPSLEDIVTAHKGASPLI